MSKVVILTDLHIGISNFNKTMIVEADKYLAFVDQRISRGDTIVLNGDTLDNRRVINIDAINLLNKWFDIWLEKRCKIICNLGNHDTRYDGQTDNTMLDLFESKVDIIREPKRVRLTGDTTAIITPYFNDKETLNKLVKLCETECLVFTHNEIHDNTLLKPEHFVGNDKAYWPKVVLNGHIHTRSSTKNIHNLGTGHQLNWGDVGQIKGFHIYDGGLKFVEYHKTLFKVIRIVDGKIDGVHPLKWLSLNKKKLKDHFVKVYVDGRMDHIAFGKFCDVMGSVDLYEVKYSESIRYDYTLTDEGVEGSVLDSMLSNGVWNEFEENVINDLYKEAVR